MPENTKSRIALYITTTESGGGSYQYARAIARSICSLDREKYDIQLWHTQSPAWSKFSRDNSIKNHILPENLKEHFAGTPLLLFCKMFLQKLKQKFVGYMEPLAPYSLQEFAPDIVIQPEIAAGIFVENAKHIGIIHDLMHRYEKRFPEVGNLTEFSIREKRFQKLILRCSVILVDSEVGRQHCLESYTHSKNKHIAIVPFTAYEEVTKCKPQPPTFDFPEKFFFYPAQFWEHKNHVGLADAVAILKGEIPNICVITSGGTNKNGFARFQAKVKQLNIENNFITPGYLPDSNIAWLYKHARALVMPTFFGPTNIPPLEAMALGCPVAISDIYGMRESCADVPLYFNPQDPNDIAQALKKLWFDDLLCQKLIQKGLQRSRLYDEKEFEAKIHNIINILQTPVNI